MRSRRIDSFKSVALQTWVFRFGTLLGVLFFIYIGYCWGVWGRHSLLLQYLFQCNCPSVSQEARYPRSVDVLVSACSYAGSILSPSGRLLAVYEKEPANVSPYLLNLHTGEKVLLALPKKSNVTFLTDDLLYLSLSYEENYVLDHTTGEQYPIHRFFLSRPDAYVGGDVDPTMLADVLRQAKYIFFRDQDDSIVVLDPGFPTYTRNNFLIDRFDLPGKNPNRTEQFLKQYDIAYQTILPYFPEEVVSPDRRFVARPDGIYLLETGQQIVKGYSASWFYRPYTGKYFGVQGWVFDSKAAIYAELFDPCLIETALITIDPACLIKVPQPVLKVKVPEEYILPNGIQ